VDITILVFDFLF